MRMNPESLKQVLPDWKRLVIPLLLIPITVYATRAGALPGAGMGSSGSILQVAAWEALYVVLCAIYQGACDRAGCPSGSVRFRVGLSLVFAIGTLVALVVAFPGPWESLYYARYLAVPLSLLAWLSLLAREENRAVLRVVQGRERLRMLTSLALMTLFAFLVVSLTDIAINGADLSTGTGIGTALAKKALVTNSLILLAAHALVFSMSGRVSTALVSVTPVLAVLVLSTLAKLKYMHAPVSPLDLLNLPEFLPLFRKFFGTPVLVASIGAALAWILSLAALRRRPSGRYPIGYRVLCGTVSLAVLAGVPVLYSWPNYDMERYFRMIGGPEFHTTENFQKNSGILLTFLAEVPSSFVKSPPDYSIETVRAAAAHNIKYAKATFRPRRSIKPNLIVVMIESFMDPMDLGYRYTHDPIPRFRSSWKNNGGGYAIVPGAFGGSIHSEFEILMGMSTLFFPDRSVPYRQYIKEDVPSLPRALKDSGYRTIAIQADPKSWFHREKVYELMGFDEKHFLNEEPGVERCRRGWWVSDRAVFERIKSVARGKKPFFVFAFPTATHSPYESGKYSNSDLKILDPVTTDVAVEVGEYINLLQETDRVIGDFLDYLQRQPDPTMLVILGDHLPPLSKAALRPFFSRISSLPDHEREWASRRVPILVAANFRHPRENIELSLNVMPSFLMEKIGVPSTGFISAGDVLRRKILVYSNYVRGADGKVWHRRKIPPAERSFVDDYFLLQYDTLIGKRHFLGPVSR